MQGKVGWVLGKGICGGTLAVYGANKSGNALWPYT
jgi:glutamate synthase domain-containing protein 3